MKYYLTTPIYYTNAAPHIGHAYTTMVADSIRRLKKMQGFDGILTTGTDEHGVNVERAALAAGKSPKEYTDVISAEFADQWRILGLHIDRFQRTTSPEHAKVVQDLFRRCRDRGYVYKGYYTGQYCIFDNAYVNDAKPGDPCPDCGRPTETVTEENYYFKLSAFQDRLIQLYEKQPDFIQPETRRNEVMAFVKGGLTDLSISRTTIKWGIPVPDEPNHVFYVWFDALTTYMSAVDGQKLWPADLHLIGKEIVRFHAIYWPAFLWAADLPIPKRIYAHGWLLFENDKMSKSRGNIVRATPIHEVLGADALRYFLLREVVFGQDGSFSYDALVGRYNADLANGLGNLASRTLSMIHQYRAGVVPEAEGDGQIAQATRETVENAVEAYDRFEFSKALESIWGLISAIDKFIVERAPWKLAKDVTPAGQKAVDEALYTAAEGLRIVTGLLYPIMPQSTAKIWLQLGFTHSIEELHIADLHWGRLRPGQVLRAVAAVFPRAEATVAIARMKELEVEEYARQQAVLGKIPSHHAAAAKVETAEHAGASAAADESSPIKSSGSPAGGSGESGVAGGSAATVEAPSKIEDLIKIDDFIKVDLRVGIIKEAAVVKGADKLLHLQVDIGEPSPRSIVAGIALAYKPETLVGRKVVIVANLQPRKLRGLESQGMIVAASLEGGSPVLAGFLEDVPVGARLK